MAEAVGCGPGRVRRPESAWVKLVLDPADTPGELDEVDGEVLLAKPPAVQPLEVSRPNGVDDMEGDGRAVGIIRKQ